MSLFRTLQNQPRVITLFTHDLEQSHTKRLIDYLQSNQLEAKMHLEISTKFPTKDQLEIMCKTNPHIMMKQIPKLFTLTNKPSFDPIFSSPLASCIKHEYWIKNSDIWVDWEKSHIGNSLQSIKIFLKK